MPILIGSEAKAFQFTQRLFEEGVFATPAIYPAVRYGEAIVRTSYMATHTEQDLDNVLEVFAKLARELGTFDDPAYADPGQRKANVFDFRLEGESARGLWCARESRIRIGMDKARVEPFRGSDRRCDWLGSLGRSTIPP